MKLRYYQSGSIEAAVEALRYNDDTVIVLPTGSGKTPVISDIAHRCAHKDKRALLLTMSEELVDQGSETLQDKFSQSDKSVGVCCAGLNRYDTDTDVIIGTIGTVVNRIYDIGRVDLIIIDEAHQIPLSEESMYQKAFSAMESICGKMPKRLGLTATPYRMDSGYIYDGKGVFTNKCYEAEVLELIENGFLCQLVGKTRKDQTPDLSSIKTSGKDFDLEQMGAVFDAGDVVHNAVDDILYQAEGRRAIMIFGTTVEHCEHIVDYLKSKGETAEYVHGYVKTLPKKERRARIQKFRDREIRFLVNCRALTTGFDVKFVDCVAILMATKSPGLYSQIVGRGLRPHPDVDDCMILDYGGNIHRHGPANAINPPEVCSRDDGVERDSVGNCMKQCTACGEDIPVAMKICHYCGAENHVDSAIVHEEQASDLAPIESAEHNVKQIAFMDWRVHVKRGTEHDETAPRTLRVMVTFMDKEWCSQFYCPEHKGARWKMENWWEKVTGHPRDTMPETSVECLDMLDEMKQRGLLNLPTHARIKEEQGQYPEITHFYWRNNDDS